MHALSEAIHSSSMICKALLQLHEENDISYVYWKKRRKKFLKATASLACKRYQICKQTLL